MIFQYHAKATENEGMTCFNDFMTSQWLRILLEMMQRAYKIWIVCKLCAHLRESASHPTPAFVLKAKCHKSRVQKWSRFASEFVEMIRDIESIENVHFDTSSREVKMTLCVCLSLYVCARATLISLWLSKSHLINMSSWFSSFDLYSN